MTKRKKTLDTQTVFDFESPIEAYIELRNQLTREMPPSTEAKEYRYEEYCIEIAASLKKAIRTSGLSREQMVDAVNDFFGWPKDDKRKSLSIHMLNNYLCKPAEYPVPSPIIHAIQRITGSIEPITSIAEMEGLKVITKEEINMLNLGRIDSALAELHRLKKTFRSQNGSGCK